MKREKDIKKKNKTLNRWRIFVEISQREKKQEGKKKTKAYTHSVL